MKAIVFSRQHHGGQGKTSEIKARVSGQEYFVFDIRKRKRYTVWVKIEKNRQTWLCWWRKHLKQLHLRKCKHIIIFVLRRFLYNVFWCFSLPSSSHLPTYPPNCMFSLYLTKNTKDPTIPQKWKIKTKKNNKTNNAKIKHKASFKKIHWFYYVLANHSWYSWAQGLPWSVVGILSEASLEKTYFPFSS